LSLPGYRLRGALRPQARRVEGITAARTQRRRCGCVTFLITIERRDSATW
jgi:hypothetical protein